MDLKWTQEELEFLNQHKDELNLITTPEEIYSWYYKNLSSTGSPFDYWSKTIVFLLAIKWDFLDNLYFIPKMYPGHIYSHHQGKDYVGMFLNFKIKGETRSFDPIIIFQGEAVWSSGDERQNDLVKEFFFKFGKYPFVQDLLQNSATQEKLRGELRPWFLTSLHWSDYGPVFEKIGEMFLDLFDKIKIDILRY